MERPREWLARRRRDPVWWTEVAQVVKTMAAAVVGWVLVSPVLHLEQPFLAPWSAILVVHATVYRTFSEGARQVGGAVAGVVIAWAVGTALGMDTLGVAVAVLVGLALGRTPWFKQESTTVAATAVIVLTTGLSTDRGVLLSRLFCTGIGIGAGVVINTLVWPPLQRRTAVRAMDDIARKVGELLVEMADGLCAPLEEERVGGWIEHTRNLDADLDRAWALVRQARESARLNPRRQAGPLRSGREWSDLLGRMEQAVAETRSMARTLGDDLFDVATWADSFGEPWTALLRRGGEAIVNVDSAAVTRVRLALAELAADLSDADLRARKWPQYGGLIVNLRNLMAAMELVVEATPVASEMPRTILGTR